MADKMIKWIEVGYKVAVVFCGVGIAFLNATFVSQSDLKRVESKIEEMHVMVVITNNNLEHFKTEFEVLRATNRDTDIRLRALEVRR